MTTEETKDIPQENDMQNDIDTLLEILIPHEKQTILVADDTEIDIDVLLAILSDDYRVVVATDGEAALESAIAFQPDLILLDVLMPGVSGFDVCSRLKANRSTLGIPVIFVTSLNLFLDEAHGLELGAVDYISKPFNPAVVKARIRNHLELKRHRDQMDMLMARKSQELTEAYNRLKTIKDAEAEFHVSFSDKLCALAKNMLGISELALWDKLESSVFTGSSSCLNPLDESVDEPLEVQPESK